MRFLRQNTAVRIAVGPFLDVTDGKTPELSLTVTGCHLTMTKDDDDGTATNLIIDADLTASGGDNDMVHITNDNAGMYDLELTAAQTNYTGRVMILIIDDDVHLPVWHEFMLIPQAIYDSFIGGTAVADGLVLGTAAYKLAVDSSNRAAADVQAISGDATGADNLEAAYDGTGYLPLYHADVHLSVDAANSQDEYTVQWYKNGVPLSSGVSSAQIQVVKRADGTDLIAATNMTQISTLSRWKYDATTTARITAGEAVLVIVTATIDSATRTWCRVIGRDSTA